MLLWTRRIQDWRKSRKVPAEPAGCSKGPFSKAAASEEPRACPLGYVEGLNDARTLHGKRCV